MTKEELQARIQETPLFLDGATGSNLWLRGMPAGVCPEQWILEHADVMIGLQKEFVEAGSQIVYAPTFSGNRLKLAEYGLEKKADAINKGLVAICKEAAEGKALVAGDLTMTGRQLSPIGTLDFEELIDIYKEQIRSLSEAGVDLLVVETMMSLQEARAALIAARETCDLAVMVTMTFEADGRTLYGTDAETAAVVLESLGAAALGANCSTGPQQMAEVIARMARVTSLPLVAKPNAGLPVLDEAGNTVYPMEPEEFARQMKQMLEAGASILGGCCGTTPSHIRALVEATGRMCINHRKKPDRCFLASERMTVSFGLSDPFLIVGERINPTGKKKLQEQLRQGSLDMVAQFAQEQEDCGAGILDINMGMSGIDEKAMMLAAMEEVMGVTNLPLSLDSSHVEVLEAALRRYPGRALINSISFETEKVKKLIPLAKKYGAMFILLPLSDEGLPKDLAEKKKIIEQILERAYAVGLTPQDVVVDGLVATVGANPEAARETLETIRYCKEKGLATICGLSNISFGLPERKYINSAFLTLAIREGLTMAIANPSQELLVSLAFATDLLLHKEDSDLRYIEKVNQFKEKHEAEAARQAELAALAAKSGLSEKKEPSGGAGAQTAKKATEGPSGKKDTKAQPDRLDPAACKVKEAVLKGNRKQIQALTEEALAAGVPAGTLLDEVLLPAINEVGDYFDAGKYFLPQLINSAEAMKSAIAVLEPLLQKNAGGQVMPTVIMATVKGDIHDIGKNLVVLMLQNYGFQVIDLGKDVSKEEIVEAAIRYQAQIIGLSALMTTTMQEMRHVVEYVRQRGVTAKIMIGGAVITQEYADEIHADGYSRDAAEAVKLAKRLVGET